MVVHLLDCGADIESDAVWRDGPPLTSAALHGHCEIVELLLSRGADANVQDYTYRVSTLLAAAKCGSIGIFRILLAHGATLEVGDNFNNALAAAVRLEHEELTTLILDLGWFAQSRWLKNSLSGGLDSMKDLLERRGVLTNSVPNKVRIESKDPKIESCKQVKFRINLEFEECVGDFDQPYAILSHTWEDEEISFQELVLVNNPRSSPSDVSDVKRKAGYRKIEKFASVAAADGFKYAWADTCCINKSDLAELSEAINTMFRWYQKSAKCYVYLADVSTADLRRLYDRKLDLLRDKAVEPHCRIAFYQSRWFTRGWTLQELLAPWVVAFYASDWGAHELKDFLIEEIHDITKIPTDVLRHGNFTEKSVSERMQWAAGRKTTRVEDMAYCLLGLFNLNMPLMYGEREGAFLRLQEEICRTSVDYSIFAWAQRPIQSTEVSDSPSQVDTYRGLFARSPSEFVVEGLKFHGNLDFDEFVPPIASTSIGFNVTFRLFPVAEAQRLVAGGQLQIWPPYTAPTDTDAKTEFFAIIQLLAEPRMPPSPEFDPLHRVCVAILVKALRYHPVAVDKQYVRVEPSVIYGLRVARLRQETPRTVLDQLPPSSIYVRNRVSIPPLHASSRWAGFILRINAENSPELHLDFKIYEGEIFNSKFTCGGAFNVPWAEVLFLPRPARRAEHKTSYLVHGSTSRSRYVSQSMALVLHRDPEDDAPACYVIPGPQVDPFTAGSRVDLRRMAKLTVNGNRGFFGEGRDYSRGLMTRVYAKLRWEPSLVQEVSKMGDIPPQAATAILTNDDPNSSRHPHRWIWFITGPTACGKTTIAKALATNLNFTFVEGDDYHPKANVAKMSLGHPLTDTDRQGWLEALRDHETAQPTDQHLVITCSALKRHYRDILREGPEKSGNLRIRIVFLDASQETLKRAAERKGHFAGPDLVKSQFEVLERPQEDERDVVMVWTEGRGIEDTEREVEQRVREEMGVDEGSFFKLT
ncbi:hypothetical protein OQA88_9137 [Cercophora sp. LCS_1]